MPGSPLSLDLARMLEEVRKAGGKLSAQHLENIAARIGSAFRAKSDEVAALRVSPDGKQLRFVFPQKNGQNRPDSYYHNEFPRRKNRARQARGYRQ